MGRMTNQQCLSTEGQWLRLSKQLYLLHRQTTNVRSGWFMISHLLPYSSSYVSVLI